MSPPYARATISTHDVAALRTSTPCLYLKNDVAHGQYSVTGPTIGGIQMQTRAIMI